MRILVTAGNTQTPIDSVRCLTNIFTGRTGARIAMAAVDRGHDVRLFTSHTETVDPTHQERIQIQAYRTFDDLHQLMADAIPAGGFGAIVHAAAVGDYHLAGAFVPVPGTRFDPKQLQWRGTPKSRMIDVAAGKVKSHHSELWLRLTPSPKLIDLVREPWGFRGVLVKFKLEVGLSRVDLLEIAEQSRLKSRADLMVANSFEGRHEEAFVGAGDYRRVSRDELATVLLDHIEALAAKPRS